MNSLKAGTLTTCLFPFCLLNNWPSIALWMLTGYLLNVYPGGGTSGRFHPSLGAASSLLPAPWPPALSCWSSYPISQSAKICFWGGAGTPPGLCRDDPQPLISDRDPLPAMFSSPASLRCHCSRGRRRACQNPRAAVWSPSVHNKICSDPAQEGPSRPAWGLPLSPSSP